MPWTWLLTQGRRSRVFQDKSVADIAQTVFAGYAPMAAWQVADEVGPFLAERRPRSYCVQYRETDYDFISRLLAEEGLGWRTEEDGSGESTNPVRIDAPLSRMTGGRYACGALDASPSTARKQSRRPTKAEQGRHRLLNAESHRSFRTGVAGVGASMSWPTPLVSR